MKDSFQSMFPPSARCRTRRHAGCTRKDCQHCSVFCPVMLSFTKASRSNLAKWGMALGRALAHLVRDRQAKNAEP